LSARRGPGRWLRPLAAVSGGLVVVLTALLIADGVAERLRVARESDRFEALEQAVLSDASRAEELAGEREVQTARTMARQERNRAFAWTLLAASAAFLAAVEGGRLLGAPGAARPASAGPQGEALVQLRPPRAVAAGPPAAAGAEPELAFVDEVVAARGASREAAIPILQALQNHYRYLPEAALRRVCELTESTPAEIAGVASFYARFRRTPVGAHLVQVCQGTACHVAGSGPVLDELRRRLEIPPGSDSDVGLRFTLDPVNCLGCCSLAPVMMVDDRVAGRLTPTSACQALAAAEAGP